MSCAQVAQLVEQRTENPRVGGSIPPLGTTFPYPRGPHPISSFVHIFRVYANSLLFFY